MRLRAPSDDEGSVLPLTLGYAVLALVLLLVCVDATSLYLAQKRVDAVADAAALAAADGFVLDTAGGTPTARLVPEEVHAQAAAIVAEAPGTALVSAATPDGGSARVVVAGTWRPPVLTLFVPDGVPLSATATSRSVLR
jgi:uncharacterized membrane protein